MTIFKKEEKEQKNVEIKKEIIQKEDKFAKVNVTERPDGNEFIVDFFISEAPEKGDSFVEYNVYRFKSFDNGTQKSFLMLSYAKRIYGDLKSAAKTLAKQRDHLMTTMIEYKIPEIKVLVAGTKK